MRRTWLQVEVAAAASPPDLEPRAYVPAAPAATSTCSSSQIRIVQKQGRKVSNGNTKAADFNEKSTTSPRQARGTVETQARVAELGGSGWVAGPLGPGWGPRPADMGHKEPQSSLCPPLAPAKSSTPHVKPT
ncbi:hypothetical protein K461DRAFT_267112 [Myriangium duriaei CBS 260.36]|uniref:Uncharacterized protein n=1 Tax=Myriangium duriaei CBS 260.36 TaxID=1168546 RepID=A0A9P4J4N8_9PEZI|nr:hypothetical protein K461DRAFT_267112 [Myriangium duriaei CBS 260.36]